MGQFLAIGLVIKHIISKSELEKGEILKDELVEKMQKDLCFDPKIYDCLEEGDNLIFELKTPVFESELVGFLQKLYPLLYPNDASFYLDTIQNLKNTPPETWIKKAENKSCEEFQMDDYGMDNYLRFDKNFQPRVSVYSKSILLSMEGKISMESYSRQFLFFKLGIMELVKEFELRSALRVYITG